MTIAQILPGKIWGGAEQVAINLAYGLKARGHEVRIIAHDNPVMRRRLASEKGLDVRFIDLHSSWPPKAVKALAETLSGCDAVHLHSTPLVPRTVMAMRKGCPGGRLAVTRHDAKSHAVPLHHRPFWPHVNKLHFVSELGMRLWSKKNPWMKESRKVALLNCVPPRETGNDAAVPSLRTIYGIGPDTPLLLFTGRMRASKGCAATIEALARVADLPWAMVFVGAPKPAEFTQTLAARAQELGIGHRVFFHGFVPDARSFLPQADVCMAPSLFIENCPLSPMEAMVEGKCVIASNNGGQPEFITDCLTGFLTPPGDIGALAHSLRTVLEFPRIRVDVGAHARTYMLAHMDYDNWIAQIEAQLYLPSPAAP